jgi:hypothetical protein
MIIFTRKEFLSVLLFFLLLSSAAPSLSQWWEKGKGYQEPSIYARAYCYGRGDKLSHEEALFIALSIDKLDKVSEFEKKQRIKTIAAMILQYIAGSTTYDEYAGCRKAHTGELIQSAKQSL